MVKFPKTCSSHESLRTAARLMSNFNIGSLPVINESKKVIGIITDRDICLALVAHSYDVAVQEVMTKKVFTCLAGDPIQSVLRTMRTKQVSRLPVVDHEQHIKGIITLKNIARHTYESKDDATWESSKNESVLKTIHSLALRPEQEAAVV